MTRQQYIELLQAKLRRLDSASRYHPRYVEGALDSAWQQVVHDVLGRDGGDPFFYTKQYTPVTVSTDSNGWYYSDLPAPVIHLPRVSSGVLRVSQISGLDMDFAPVSERNFTLMRKQDVFNLGETIYYHVTKDQIKFSEKMTASIASSGVTVDMLVPFSSYDLDEELPIPAGQSQNFLASTLQFLMPTMPVDLSNTNAEGQ